MNAERHVSGGAVGAAHSLVSDDRITLTATSSFRFCDAPFFGMGNAESCWTDAKASNSVERFDLSQIRALLGPVFRQSDQVSLFDHHER